ncbi:MAG: hypothetical protein LIO75_00475 [Lachnospiraceae bacterium]|nr:hypothetical protein [Lachnospiraceae bacterium]
MKNKIEDDDSAYMMYELHRKEVRRQLVPPIVFFAAIGVIILISLVKHQQQVNSGVAEITADAILVDYMTLSLGQTIYENTDELDDSYGDYFYLGADFLEVGSDVTLEVFGHVGTVVFEGGSMVETYCWICDDDEVTQTDVDAMAGELTTAYGDYTEDGSGTYYWYADEDGMLGDNDGAAWVSCGLNGDGILEIRGEALQ